MTSSEPLTNDEVSSIVEEAYLFSFPIMMGYRFAYGLAIAEGAPSYRGPMNELHGNPKTLDPAFRDVISPNADTPYSLAALDLRAEPLVLRVPEVFDRYYVIQMEDLYGYNAHYVGTRAKGSAAGTYLLAGPGWDGETPQGITEVLAFETDLVLVIGRTQLLGSADVPRLTEVMKGYEIERLSGFLGSEVVAGPSFDWPHWDDESSRDERFIGMVNGLLELCQPTHSDDSELMDRLVSVGIGAGLEFDSENLSDERREAMRKGVESARKKMTDQALQLAPLINGWMGLEGFGDREFFSGNHLLRAGAAMAGWGANDRIEAYYPLCRVDNNDETLSGDHRYSLTFTDTPPAEAFWSVTIYDTSYDGTAGYLVDNPIDRYLINSTTEGLATADDGSLRMTIQRDEPEQPTERSNWLPSPEGTFYLILRIYMPKPAALNGSWQPPPVIRID